MEKTMYGILKTTGICPIMVAPELSFAADAAHALAGGGLPVCEVLLHRDSLNRIKSIAKNAPEVIVGAGSVISLRDAEEAMEAGAKFFVAPGLVPEVVEFAMKKNMPILPGCVTASDISIALKLQFIFKIIPSLRANIKSYFKIFPDLPAWRCGNLSSVSRRTVRQG